MNYHVELLRNRVVAGIATREEREEYAKLRYDGCEYLRPGDKWYDPKKSKFQYSHKNFLSLGKKKNKSI